MDDREDGEFLSDSAMDAEELSPYQIDDLDEDEDVDDMFGGGGVLA